MDFSNLAARAQSLADDLVASTASTASELSDWADALVIATATDTHADLIRLGAEAGLPVFCEKPISLDLRSTDYVLRAVDESGNAGIRAVYVLDSDGTILHKIPWYQPGNVGQFMEIFQALGLE